MSLSPARDDREAGLDLALLCVFWVFVRSGPRAHTGQQPCHFLPPWWKLEGDP